MRSTVFLALFAVSGAFAADAQTSWSYPQHSVPTKVGKRLFYFENSGHLNRQVLYVKDGDRPARVLLDPNGLSADGTVALSVTSESPNGRYMAYGVSVSGSDWQEFRVRDVETGRDLRDTVKFAKFSGISWTRDNRGFFYSGYGAPATGNAGTRASGNQRVYYHRIGTPQSEDQMIYDRRDQPDWRFVANVTEDGRYAVITVHEGTDPRTRLYYIFLDNPNRPRVNAPVVRVVDRLEAEYEFIHSSGDYFLVKTTLGAPKGRVIRMDVNNIQPDRWVTVIPESKDTLTSAVVAGDHLVTSYLQDAHSSLRVYGMPRLEDPRRQRGRSGPNGRMPGEVGDRAPAPSDDRRAQSAPGYPFIGEITLPGPGAVDAISADPDDSEMFYSFVSPQGTRSVYRSDVRRRTNELFKA